MHIYHDTIMIRDKGGVCDGALDLEGLGTFSLVRLVQARVQDRQFEQSASQTGNASCKCERSVPAREIEQLQHTHGRPCFAASTWVITSSS